LSIASSAPSGPRAICAIVSDGSFSDRRGLLGLARHPEIDRLTSIVAETTKKIFGAISLENQQRNFLTGLVTENAVTKGKFASDFIALYDQETIEWE
jgi:hypothetical protein